MEKSARIDDFVADVGDERWCLCLVEGIMARVIREDLQKRGGVLGDEKERDGSDFGDGIRV